MTSSQRSRNFWLWEQRRMKSWSDPPSSPSWMSSFFGSHRSCWWVYPPGLWGGMAALNFPASPPATRFCAFQPCSSDPCHSGMSERCAWRTGTASSAACPRRTRWRRPACCAASRGGHASSGAAASSALPDAPHPSSPPSPPWGLRCRSVSRPRACGLETRYEDLTLRLSCCGPVITSQMKFIISDTRKAFYRIKKLQRHLCGTGIAPHQTK